MLMAAEPTPVEQTAFRALDRHDEKKLARLIGQCSDAFVANTLLVSAVGTRHIPVPLVQCVLKHVVFANWLPTLGTVLDECARLDNPQALQVVLEKMRTEGIDPMRVKTKALEMAAWNASVPCAQQLCVVFTDHRQNTEALAVSIAHDFEEGVEIFWPNARPFSLHKQLQKDLEMGTLLPCDLSPTEQYFMDKVQRMLLTQEVAPLGAAPSKVKKI